MKLKDLLSQRRVVEVERAECDRQLEALDVLIASQRKRENLPPDPSAPTFHSNGTGEKQRRTRGTLKAAKTAAMSLEEFTRSELFDRIEIEFPTLAGKIRPDAQRGTIRTLIADNLIAATDRKQEGEIIYRSLRK